jgi:hypothetical protein
VILETIFSFKQLVIYVFFFLRKNKGRKRKKQGQAREPSTGSQTLGLTLFFSLGFFFCATQRKIIGFIYSLVLT